MHYTVTQAVRFVNRILGPYLELQEEARCADAGFDGGEFSGPAHDHMVDAKVHRVMGVVADRTGYTINQIYQEMAANDMRWWPTNW